MKTAKFISFAAIIGLASALVLTSCESNPEATSQEDILPTSFRVDIPSSISSSGSANGRSQTDSISGNDIYQNLGTFIAVGKEASKIVEAFITGIRVYHIDRVMTMTYVGDDDNRAKSLVVLANVEYEGQTWDYELTITDLDSEDKPDGGKALQIFWNKTSPVQGIAIIKPYNCDRIKNATSPDALFRIDYSEAGTADYDVTMGVSISGLALGDPLESPFAMNTLHMFVGKKGDVVDVYGNSNHPNAVLFSNHTGFNWAFVASGNDAKNIGVAEVGLPPNTLDSDDRNVILKEYSIKNVFTNEITAVWPAIDQDVLAAYLSTATAPGYFNANGFVSGGTSPGATWDALAPRLDKLSPYNPKATNDMVVTFK